MNREFTAADFDYALPPELIAQHPLKRRDASRLLHVSQGALEDRTFSDMPDLLSPGDLLVLNDTRVIKARLLGEKSSGGRVEALLERVLSGTEALAQLRASKTPRPGTRLRFANMLDAEVLGREGEFFRLRFDLGDEPAGGTSKGTATGAEGPATGLQAALDQYGSVPLPPYIAHTPDAEDESRYQTVFARAPGSVAAPTAGLHFDQAMLDRLAARGINHCFVTLHVGAGTFQPMRVERVAEHRMHAERYEIPRATRDAISAARLRKGAVVAVGTTCARALESAALAGADYEDPASVAEVDNVTGSAGDSLLQVGPGETRLFITPGFRFRVVDRLLTNFHLPRSTLMMLVSAFSGMERIRAAYAHAVERRYRFFS